MTVFQFTNFWFEFNGELRPAPPVPADKIAVPYFETGYQSGWYWGLFPLDWTVQEVLEDNPTIQMVGFEAYQQAQERMAKLHSL